MRYDQKQFTQQGLNLFTNALSQKQSITIDKVIMDNLPTSNLSNLALLTLDDFANAQSFPANYTKVDNNMLTVDSVISNQGFTNSYSANEIGLVGHTESNNGETLIAILVASDPFVLPAQQNDETPLHLIPNVTIQLTNNDMGQVPVDTAQDAYIPQQDLDSLVAQHGYIKLADADSRYVKQTDFQNEVNNSVNEKADQSDVNQKFNQAESDVQTKANQSDLNTTNSNVSNNAQNISNLQSSKVDRNKFHNLISSSNVNINNTFGDIQAVYLTAGKKYWLSAMINNGNGGLVIYINNQPDQDNYSVTGSNTSPYFSGNSNQMFKTCYVPNNTQAYYINIQTVNQNFTISNFTLTQTDNYVPFEATDSTTQDSTLTPLSYTNQVENKTNNLSNDLSSNQLPQTLNQATAHSDQNYGNAVHDNHDGTISSSSSTFSIGKAITPCDLNDVNTNGFFYSTNFMSDYANVPSGVYQTVAFFLLVMSNGNDVYQQISSPATSPQQRTKGWGNWGQWTAL